MNDRLVIFLYILLRDSVPAGEVLRVLQQADQAFNTEVVFSSAGLKALAEELAARIDWQNQELIRISRELDDERRRRADALLLWSHGADPVQVLRQVLEMGDA